MCKESSSFLFRFALTVVMWPNHSFLPQRVRLHPNKHKWATFKNWFRFRDPYVLWNHLCVGFHPLYGLLSKFHQSQLLISQVKTAAQHPHGLMLNIPNHRCQRRSSLSGRHQAPHENGEKYKNPMVNPAVRKKKPSINFSPSFPNKSTFKTIQVFGSEKMSEQEPWIEGLFIKK